MTLQTSSTYGPTAKFFHWLVVALLVAQYTIGSIMPHIGRNTQDAGWVHWHLLVGALILLAIVLRFAWRIKSPVPEPAADTNWERMLATFTHWMLYLLVFVITVLGWAAANSRGWEVKLFGLVPLPALCPKGSAWGHEAGDIHNVLIYVLLGFIALHLAGALKHHFIDRNDILKRMLPGSR
ncbi:MAG: cytochrome b [Alphaproteobacteria bacterium]|nr:cytochrome b [Alphaproteobacteria bacterium]